MKRIASVLAALALAVALAPGVALASGSSTCQSYNSPQLCSIASNVSGSQTTSTSGSPGSGATTNSGTLPFTGLDVVLLAAGGGALLTAGLVVRRLSRGVE